MLILAYVQLVSEPANDVLKVDSRHFRRRFILWSVDYLAIYSGIV